MADKKDKKFDSGGGSTDGAKKMIVIAFIFMGLVPIFGGFFVYFLSPIEALLSVRNFFAPFFEENFLWMQIISVIFSVLFLWGIIYILSKTNYLEMKREQFLDILWRGNVSRRRSLRAWKQIQKRFESEDQNNWKLAILEVDHILNEILKMSGYLGDSLNEKLEIITPVQLANIEDVKLAHRIKNKIDKDPTDEITRQETEEAIAIYKEAFKQLNLINE